MIPFYNEGRRVEQVLEEIGKVRNLLEIICVDDGSDEDNSAEIRARFPHVQLVRLPQNLGKSGAVRAGLERAKGTFVMLLDADLRNLDHAEIETAIDAFQQSAGIDMLILRRTGALFWVRMNRSDLLFSGERILRRSDLEDILSGSVQGWQLEAAINTWMYRRRKKVAWVPHSATSVQKVVKRGVLRGLNDELGMFAQVISAAGWPGLLAQAFFFARTRLPTGRSLTAPGPECR